MRRLNLRRRCSIVLRSAGIRNVHDTVIALGLGADGVCPYVMVEVVCVDDYPQDVSNLAAALSKGIEKVISTIGIHEVRGYARQFSSIGIKPELAEIFHTEAFAASDTGGVGFAHRAEDLVGQRAPNLEDPRAPIRSWRDRPSPVGFGPIARHWSPRRERAGTHDRAWQEKRQPLPPSDFQARFNQCAPDDLQVPGLKGGEPVRLTGVWPERPQMAFTLPRVHLAFETRLGRERIEHRPETGYSSALRADDERPDRHGQRGERDDDPAR